MTTTIVEHETPDDSYMKSPWHDQERAIETLRRHVAKRNGMPLSAVLDELPSETLIRVEAENENFGYTQLTTEQSIHAQFLKQKPEDVKSANVATVLPTFDFYGLDKNRPVCVLKIPKQTVN